MFVRLIFLFYISQLVYDKLIYYNIKKQVSNQTPPYDISSELRSDATTS